MMGETHRHPSRAPKRGRNEAKCLKTILFPVGAAPPSSVAVQILVEYGFFGEPLCAAGPFPTGPQNSRRTVFVNLARPPALGDAALFPTGELVPSG
ncbi:hypothetical protein AVEN_150247-1 [Araneus ventricosus]|uniref:Uncharacterized protein n=1 Tax=Araneus ventricosus TaxID=182803 RepID=A0A4Y2MYU1_ARAVE|nr:hypothetical protein AVEN_150247-1 [Araneus ventricosus]